MIVNSPRTPLTCGISMVAEYRQGSLSNTSKSLAGPCAKQTNTRIANISVWALLSFALFSHYTSRPPSSEALCCARVGYVVALEVDLRSPGALVRVALVTIRCPGQQALAYSNEHEPRTGKSKDKSTDG